MTGALLRRSTLLLALAGGLFTAGGVQAQEFTVRGRVIGPDSEPLPGQRVVLHRVDATGGATIAETLSDGDGRFELTAAASTDTAAVLFVAARYDEELYIGPPFRADDALAAEQLIQVGVPELSASALMEQGDGMGIPMPRTRPEPTRTWMLVLIPLLGIAGVAVYTLIPRGRIPHDRSLLIRVAELDERIEAAPDAQRASLIEERSRIMAELRQD